MMVAEALDILEVFMVDNESIHSILGVHGCLQQYICLLHVFAAGGETLTGCASC